jgi:hypothetical protein
LLLLKIELYTIADAMMITIDKPAICMDRNDPLEILSLPGIKKGS